MTCVGDSSGRNRTEDKRSFLAMVQEKTISLGLGHYQFVLAGRRTLWMLGGGGVLIHLAELCGDDPLNQLVGHCVSSKPMVLLLGIGLSKMQKT